MSAIKKLITGAAGAAGGGAAAGLNIEEIFSNYLYTGNGSSKTITNDIDLSNEGGMVWIKRRSSQQDHNIFDTERGAYERIKPNLDNAENYQSNGLTSFNNNGWSMLGSGNINGNTDEYASWTFRKASKFFDVQTFTVPSTGTSQTISHNLGTTVGFVITKITSTTSSWFCFHTSRPNKYLTLNSNVAEGSWNWSSTSTEIDIGAFWSTNYAGATGVAYFFADNNSDGNFGPTGDQDVIKCGSYTANGTDQFIDLGFEPQWVMIKCASHGGTYYDWYMFDNMRKLDASFVNNAALLANSDNSEGTAYASSGYNLVQPTPTGMIVEGTSGPNAVGTNTYGYIYIAIRRGPMAVPTDVNDVFSVTSSNGVGTGTQIATGFPVDTTIVKKENSPANWELWDRIRGPRKYLFTDTNFEEGTAFSSIDQWLVDDMTGFSWAAGDGYSNTSGDDFVNYSWRRAPNFFDTVAYTGTGSATSINHNLGVSPEMIWIKNRESTYDYQVWHKDLTSGNHLILNTTSAQTTSNSPNLGTVSSTTFNIGSYVAVNGNGSRYIAHLFASLDGISKVGTFTHTFNGGDTNVDCGFSSGARFVIIKRISATSSWLVYDTARGIVAGNDPYLQINTNDAEVTNNDGIDPYSAGFTMPSSGVNTGTYIFYAVA